MLCVCPGKDLPGQPETGLRLDVLKEPCMENTAEVAWSAASVKVLSMGAVPALAVLQGSYLGRLQQLFQVPSVSFLLGQAVSPCPQHASSRSSTLSTAGTLKSPHVTLRPSVMVSALAINGDVNHCRILSSQSFPGCFQAPRFGRASCAPPS